MGEGNVQGLEEHDTESLQHFLRQGVNEGETQVFRWSRPSTL